MTRNGSVKEQLLLRTEEEPQRETPEQMPERANLSFWTCVPSLFCKPELMHFKARFLSALRGSVTLAPAHTSTAEEIVITTIY